MDPKQRRRLIHNCWHVPKWRCGAVFQTAAVLLSPRHLSSDKRRELTTLFGWSIQPSWNYRYNLSIPISGGSNRENWLILWQIGNLMPLDAKRLWKILLLAYQKMIFQPTQLSVQLLNKSKISVTSLDSLLAGNPSKLQSCVLLVILKRSRTYSQDGIPKLE